MAQAPIPLVSILSCFTHYNIYLPHKIIYALLMALDTNFLSPHISFFLFAQAFFLSTLHGLDLSNLNPVYLLKIITPFY